MPSIVAAAGLAGAGFAKFHAESGWMFAGAAALLLLGAFWISVLHKRTSASAVVFLISAAIVAAASAQWLPRALSAALGGATIVLLVRDLKAPAT